MTKMTYGEQLKHPNWQRRRLERLRSSAWSCDNCGDKETTLHVHHKHYVKGRMAWEYNDTELLVLCEPCHEEEHAIADDLKALLLQVDTTTALALLKGYFSTADWFESDIGDMGRDRNPHVWAQGFVAYLAAGLDPSRMLRLADYAASLYDENSEERRHWQSYRIEFEALG